MRGAFAARGCVGTGLCATAGLFSRAEPRDQVGCETNRPTRCVAFHQRLRTDVADGIVSPASKHGWTSQPRHTGRLFDPADERRSPATEGSRSSLAWKPSSNSRRSKLVALRMTARAGSGERLRQSLRRVDSDRSVACSRRRRNDRLTPYAGSVTRRKRPAGQRFGAAIRPFERARPSLSYYGSSFSYKDILKRERDPAPQGRRPACHGIAIPVRWQAGRLPYKTCRSRESDCRW
jgi:hypothetical protein